ncbi:sushi domain-containing protein 1 isoform X1 [Salvelinus fontinalis]|uniref:sushi domain-containing protein 1 isoform X1 n=1 Tax=Salvelinus fontinalis TaxID=8038 RepID=UPI0024860537|nr:sushi domain-containing protein 1 isoform X1 [Salvelinus fontinalis]XP_055775078.1 sushi domain-containing protein 1 isoform X1 [Salvelinus fontinalis]XP_055775080.1 sushi domain-containing protein 1 isoform X1 [Salvelinus fontinalis]
MYWRTALVILAFLTHAITEMRVTGQTLDVCATCHPNATCEEKVDGTGKACNCMYGFVGNGRTYCQDKNECQIGANKICGQHTACHNTYGSYYCTCLAGYSPSNNMAIFIPNDGTRCQDINECRVQGICGEGGKCTNMQGYFNCLCQVGYQVHNGAEPFHPHQDKALCKAIDCGQPPSALNAVQLSATGTRYGSIAKFGCSEGFFWKSGENSSVCGAESVWKGPSLVCEEVDCGLPPALPHSVMLWNQSTRIGSEVVYQCNSGYYNVGEGNVSVCTANGKWDQTSFICKEITCGDPPMLPHTGQVWNGSTNPGSTVLFYCKGGFYREGGGNISQCTRDGYWTKATLSCKEVDCSSPPALPNSVMLWNQSTRIGSEVVYQCNSGYYNVGKGNVSVCTANGKWDQTSFICKEITCGDPPMLPHTGQVWNGSTNPGSTVLFYCKEGFYRKGGGNISYCTENGFWTKATLSCKEIMCGGPPILPHTGQVWNGSTNPGSTVLFYCKEGFHRERGGGISQCTKDGNWTKATLSCKAIDCGQPPSALNAVQLSATGTRYGSIAKFCCSEGFFWKSGENSSVCGAESVWKGPSLVCEATCGPAPALANTEVMLQNTSVVFHRCLEGFHSWRGRNTSVCDITGKWQAATMRCREIKPAISDLVVFNEKCLRWKADKYEEDTENYRVAFVGFRAYQRSFHDKRKKLLSSTSDHPEICLNLLPVTNYTISITALSARFTSTLTTNTSLQVPQAPEILYREIEAPLPTLWLRRSADTLDPISFYQVFVLPLEGTLVFDCSSPKTPDFSSQRKPHGQYITAQLHLRDIGKEINLTLGDGHYYGGFYNAPLQKGRDYYIILRAVSQWGGAFKHSCVIWAKVRDISYIMKVSSLFAGGSIGVFALAIFLGHCYTWFCKKT